jgi:uncharacterized protein YyaL (SSP411 family)
MAASNRLIHETSLYLRQHAHNPVDWYPWGPEALARARELDRPIFLSIGYSACHWCHVMEHESFEDPAIARVMNEHFVCIKVDREERPDLDIIYMNSLQVLTQEGGGWPLSVFLTPELTPFYAGTYYPPDDRYAPQRPSFGRLLLAIHDAWMKRRAHVEEVGRNVAAYLQGVSRLEPDHKALTGEMLSDLPEVFRRSFDVRHGGFGSAPKFPHALELRLLLRLGQKYKDANAIHMVRFTLEKMARGGIFDQLGGGFHRYSVDDHWLVPHFEKMLYDNALLATTFVEAWQFTGDPFHRRIAAETLDYVLREMTAKCGAYFSTQDADSEGHEGKFYVWSEEEVRSVLGKERGEIACRVWGVTGAGNFEGKNILHRSRSDEEDAKQLGLSLQEFSHHLQAARKQLYEARARRVWPARDEKILTSWNGLMISAFARAGAAFGERRYIEAAVAAASYILERMRMPDGHLYRTAAEGQDARLNGYLEDYAFLSDALVTLYEATFDTKWLEEAIELADLMIREFADPNGPGFFFVAANHEPLIARTKDMHDGSIPSGNAVAVTVLLRLARLLDRPDFTRKAEETLLGYRSMMVEHPAASGQMLMALALFLDPSTEVAVIGGKEDPATQKVLSMIHQAFRPNQVLAFHDPATGAAPGLVPLLKDKSAVGGAPTVYVCEAFVCKAPLVGVEAVERAFGRRSVN